MGEVVRRVAQVRGGLIGVMGSQQRQRRQSMRDCKLKIEIACHYSVVLPPVLHQMWEALKVRAYNEVLVGEL